MKPKVKEFTNDQALITEVQELTARGVDRTDIYVLTHDADRTNRLADNANINTIGIEEEGIGTAVGNIFRKKEDDLREKLQNIRDNCF
ncbi:general stress protein [Pseudogracilibacillus sp. SO30301A]|uniref:general stress protein n=1 Tax=Pseudogracilibacillus sp. SO30301A TaxID=3098291 RepID=UPI003FA7EDD1